KATPSCADCLWDSDYARRDSVNRRELVCAIARDTSKDSAGTESATRCRIGDSPHERDALGRARTKRNYHCAELRYEPGPFPGSENVPSSRSLPLAFFTTAGDQRSITG